ncbi:MAG: hypothetical protein HC906_05830 [Bacteroidales bacterium]|nr:hypothetical protein [Bacteroidales bacterium]
MKKYILITLISGLLFSCSEDFFNKETDEQILPNEYYNTYLDVVTGYYGIFTFAQQASVNLVVMNGLLSDEMDVTSQASSSMNQLNDHNVFMGNSFSDPSIFYKIIVNSNELLLNMEKVNKLDKDFEAIDLFYFQGITVALRSWAYLNIIRLYGDAIIVKDNLADVNSAFSAPVKFDDMIDTLINHVKPYLFEDANLEAELFIGSYSVNKEALLAELYLEQNKAGSADSAAKYARLAIHSLDGFSKDIYKITNLYEEEKWINIFIGAENNLLEVFTAAPFHLIRISITGLKNIFITVTRLNRL